MQLNPILTRTSDALTHFATCLSATAATNDFFHLPQLAGWLSICFLLRSDLTSPSLDGPWHLLLCHQPSTSSVPSTMKRASNTACHPPLQLHVLVEFPRLLPCWIFVDVIVLLIFILLSIVVAIESIIVPFVVYIDVTMMAIAPTSQLNHYLGPKPFGREQKTPAL